MSAAAAVLVCTYAVLRTTRVPGHAPVQEREPEPRQPVLETLHFSHETRARPLRRISSALTLLTITLVAAGGIAALIYRGLTSLG